MKKFIYYTSLFSICTEALVFRFIIDLKLFYLIVLVNFFLFLLSGKLRISRGLIFFYLYLIFSGALSIILQTNHVAIFFAQFLGIFFISLYFYNFYKFFNLDVKRIFRDYVYLCLGIAVIGYPLLIYNQTIGSGLMFHSILTEPAHYCTFVLPAFYYSLKNKEFPRYIYVILLVSIILSGSSLGLMGIFLSILLMPRKIKITRLILPLIVSVAGLLALYTFYAGFRLRVDDTFKSLKESDLSGANLSTYALLSNLYVTSKSLSNNPVLGSGLGSHELSHKQHIGSITGIESFEQYISLNSKDANSLFLRSLSDLGILGTLGMLFFIFKNYNRNTVNEDFVFISRAIFIYFFCKLLREGHYFSPEMYFFVFAYMFLAKKETDKAYISSNNIVGEPF